MKDTTMTIEIATKKTALISAMVSKLNAQNYSADNAKKRDQYIAFFERNDAAMTLLAKDDASAEFIGDQLYAVEKLRDVLLIAVQGNNNIAKLSVMHHFMLRVLKSLHQLESAKVAYDLNNVIDCAISNRNAPRGEGAALIVCSDKLRSNESAQRPQVVNVLRTLRVLNETAEGQKINLKTNVAKALLKMLATYDGQEVAA